MPRNNRGDKSLTRHLKPPSKASKTEKGFLMYTIYLTTGCHLSGRSFNFTWLGRKSLFFHLHRVASGPFLCLHFWFLLHLYSCNYYGLIKFKVLSLSVDFCVLGWGTHTWMYKPVFMVDIKHTEYFKMLLICEKGWWQFCGVTLVVF